MKQKSTIQQKKFNNLLKDKKSQHDPERTTSNYSNYVLSEAEKSVLWKGLNFSIPPKKLHHALYLKNKQFVIQKSDKGNSIVVVNRDNYIDEMENFLSNQSKISENCLKDHNFLNFITSQKKKKRKKKQKNG